MKRMLFLLLAGCLFTGTPALLRAQTYRIVNIKGDCKVRDAATWRPLTLTDRLIPASTLRSGSEGTQLYIRESDALVCYLIKLRESEFELSRLTEKDPQSLGTALASFSKIVITPVPESVIKLTDGGDAFRGENAAAQTESQIFGSLCRKMQGEFCLEKLAAPLSDYPVGVERIPAEATGAPRVAVTNYSDRTLFIGLFRLAKNSLGDRELSSLNDNALMEQPARSSMPVGLASPLAAGERIIALAAEEPFDCAEVAELLTAGHGRTNTSTSTYQVGIATD